MWEKSQQTPTVIWNVALGTCISKNVGGRKGWRLPPIPELASLIDPSVGSPGPTLPPGHPFLNVLTPSYWSATTDYDGPTIAWHADFNLGDVGGTFKTGSNRVWCVRGGMNAEQY